LLKRTPMRRACHDYSKHWLAPLRSRTGITQCSYGKSHVGRASMVLHHAPDLANAVLMGHISLDNAYEEARLRRGQRAIVVAEVTRDISVRQTAEEIWSETDHGASGRWWRRKGAWHSRCRPQEQLAGKYPPPGKAINPPLNPARDRLSRPAVNSGKCKWVLKQARADEQG
jgi:hypothetical protein